MEENFLRSRVPATFSPIYTGTPQSFNYDFPFAPLDEDGYPKSDLFFKEIIVPKKADSSI